jgi:hypothetical protein
MYDIAYCRVWVTAWEAIIKKNINSASEIKPKNCIIARIYYYFVMFLLFWGISRYFLLPYWLSKVVQMLLVSVSHKRSLRLCEYLFCLTPPSHFWFFTPIFEFRILFPVFLLCNILMEVAGTLLVRASHKRCLYLGQHTLSCSCISLASSVLLLSAAIRLYLKPSLKSIKTKKHGTGCLRWVGPSALLV